MFLTQQKIRGLGEESGCLNTITEVKDFLENAKNLGRYAYVRNENGRIIGETFFDPKTGWFYDLYMVGAR